jgi:hypothetical protein
MLFPALVLTFLSMDASTFGAVMTGLLSSWFYIPLATQAVALFVVVHILLKYVIISF